MLSEGHLCDTQAAFLQAGEHKLTVTTNILKNVLVLGPLQQWSAYNSVQINLTYKLQCLIWVGFGFGGVSVYITLGI